jgi:hypothetical protein
MNWVCEALLTKLSHVEAEDSFKIDPYQPLLG